MTDEPEAAERGGDVTLAELRARIDAVDEAVLDLIARRQSLARQVRAFKSATGEPGRPPDADGLKLRPDREAHVIRRLLDRAGPADRALVLALWRELLSAGLAIQDKVTVAVWSASEGAVDAARLRFGVSADYRRTDTWEAALSLAEAGSTIAVLALEPDAPWWLRLSQRSSLWVFESLGDGGPTRPDALAVGRVPPASLARGVTYSVAEPGGRQPERAHVLAQAGDRVLCVTPDGDQGPELDRVAGVLGCAPVIG